MTKQTSTTDIDRLSDAVNNLQKCLECTICMELMVEPLKTRCGHSFCQQCIKKVLSKKNAYCPLCNKSLTRRSVSKDDHLESCIQKFNKLVTAIQIDSHIDILLHSKQPRDTRESCSNSDESQYSNSNKRKSPKTRLARLRNQDTSKRGKSSSVNRKNVVEHDDPKCDPNILNIKQTSILSGSSTVSTVRPFPAAASGNVDHSALNAKVITWLHSFSDKPSTSRHIKNEEQASQTKVTPIKLCDSDNEQKQIKESANFAEDDKRSHIRKSTGMEQPDKIDMLISATSGLKYNASHARIRANSAKNNKKSTNPSKSGSEEFGNLNSSSLAAGNNQTSQVAPIDASDCSAVTDKQSPTDATWSRVIEFGKEMRTKRKKVKKLNVSTEKNKNPPRIMEDILLSSKVACDPAKNVANRSTNINSSNMSEENTSNALRESIGQKQDAVDKNLSNTKIIPLKATSNAMQTRNRKNSFSSDKTDNSTTEVNYHRRETSYITLEEGKQLRIENLNNSQMNEIIGCKEVREDVPLFNRADVSDKSRHLDEHTEPVTKIRHSSLSWNKSIALTPQKRNQTAREREANHDIKRTPIGNFETLPCALTENRTPEPEANNSARKISEEIDAQFPSLTPNRSRLSLKRNKSDSPLLSDIPLTARLSCDVKESNRKSVDSPTSQVCPSVDRLTAVRRNLRSQISGEDQPQVGQDAIAVKKDVPLKKTVDKGDKNVSRIARQTEKFDARFVTSGTLKDMEKRGSSVIFMQLGTLIRRREIRYYHMGTTRHEYSTPAEIPVTSVYNMQQSVSKFEIQEYNKNKLGNLEMSPKRYVSNESQESTNITVIENIRFVDNSTANSHAALENAELSILPACNIAASSTPKKDQHLSPRKNPIGHSSINANRRSNESIRNAGKEAQTLDKTPYMEKSAIQNKTLHVHSKSDIKLLSPDKDSQLKFLAMDSPVSQLERSRVASSMRQQRELRNPATTENNFSEIKDSHLAATAAYGLPSESSEFAPQFQLSKKRKRTKCAGDKEPFHSGSSPDHKNNNSDSDDTQCTVKLNEYAKLPKYANLDTKKKRRLSSPNDRNAEMICSSAEEENTHEKRFKRIVSNFNSDTESESAYVMKRGKRNRDDGQRDQANASITSTPKKKQLARENSDEDLRIRNIVDKWSNEYNVTLKKLSKEDKDTQGSAKSIKCLSEEKAASYRSSLSSANALEIKKCKDAKISQKSATTESDMFESNSIFGSTNLDIIMLQSTKSSKSKPSQKSMSSWNDDIINKVLQASRSRDNPDACQSSAPRYDGTSQRSKDNKECNLLQDNFDEIIANVELPQSRNVIPCIDQPDRNLNHTLTEPNTSNRPAMINEPCGVMQETLEIPASSTSDMFEQCNYPVRHAKKSPSKNTVSENSDKENILCNRERNNRTDDHRDKKNLTTRDLPDAVDKDSRMKITSKNDVSHKKDKSFDSNERPQIDKEIHVPIHFQSYVDDNEKKRTIANNESNLKDTSFEYDTFMNITQQQAQLLMFEEDLFGISSATRNQTKATKMIPQNDPFQDEQRTPKKRKQSFASNKNATSDEHLAEEDDVVESTPETKMKNNGGNVKAVGSNTRRNIAASFLSPISKHMVLEPTSTSTTPCKKLPILRSGSSTPMTGIYPLYQSTPKVTKNPMLEIIPGIIRPHAFTGVKKTECEVSSSTPSMKRMESKMLENWQPDKCKLCFVCSGLTTIQIMSVKEFAQKYNANYVNQFDQGVTHVIVSTMGEKNVAKSTLKYLQGIAHRKWIVSYKWVEDCIREQKLLDEIPYEATTYSCGTNGAGPRNSRLRKKGLFEDFTFWCVEPYDNVSLNQYQDLLLATGATVVDSLEALAAEKKRLKGIVIQDNIHDDQKIEYWYRTARAAPIIIDWIVECIGQYKLFLLTPYIQNLSPQDFRAIGYPRELVEDDDYSDTSA